MKEIDIRRALQYPFYHFPLVVFASLNRLITYFYPLLNYYVMHYPQTIIYDLLLASNRGIIEGYDIPACFLSSPIESDLSHESKEPNYDED